jgi:hypothetical protein
MSPPNNMPQKGSTKQSITPTLQCTDRLSISLVACEKKMRWHQHDASESSEESQHLMLKSSSLQSYCQYAKYAKCDAV